jgi:hypothetical protein
MTEDSVEFTDSEFALCYCSMVPMLCRDRVQSINLGDFRYNRMLRAWGLEIVF